MNTPVMWKRSDNLTGHERRIVEAAAIGMQLGDARFIGDSLVMVLKVTLGEFLAVASEIRGYEVSFRVGSVEEREKFRAPVLVLTYAHEILEYLHPYHVPIEYYRETSTKSEPVPIPTVNDSPMLPMVERITKLQFWGYRC